LLKQTGLFDVKGNDVETTGGKSAMPPLNSGSLVPYQRRISGVRVVAREPEAIGERGSRYPSIAVDDSGTELNSSAMLKWRQDRAVEWHSIAPGKPMQNGFVESQWMPLGRMRPWTSVLFLPSQEKRRGKF